LIRQCWLFDRLPDNRRIILKVYIAAFVPQGSAHKLMPRNVLESLIIILIALTFGMVLVLPKFDETAALKDKVELKRVDLANRENYFKELEKIAKEFKGNRENLDKIKTALPIGPMAPSLANFIQSASSQTGLILKNFGYGSTNVTAIDETAAMAVQEYEISLTLSGSYNAFKDFLDRIEKSSRLIEIADIAFIVSESSKDAVQTLVSPTNSGVGKDDNPTDNPDSDTEEKKTDNRIYEFVLKLKAHFY
jgi:Tfp pilus assembly protein PilO